MSQAGARRWFAAAGAVLAAAGVASAAWAAHGGGDALATRWAAAAALHLSLHGIALAALDRGTRTRLLTLALSVLLTGTVLFAGTLLAAAAWGTGTGPAPAGGMLTIAGWLLAGGAMLQRSTE